MRRVLAVLLVLALSPLPASAQSVILSQYPPGQALAAASLPVVLASNQGTLTVDTELSAAVALAENLANPTAPGVGAYTLVFDGSTWDRWTGAVSATGLSIGGVSATIFDLADSNPLATQIVDANGDAITSFGGGVQYTEGDTDASITGTAMMFEVSANTLGVINSTNRMPVTCDNCGGGAGGTSQNDNSSVGSITGIGALYDLTPPTITDGNVGLPRMDSSRYLYTVFPSAQTVTANAGTNLNTSLLALESGGNLATIAGMFGTAGTADSQVVSVQGIASMTALQVQSNSANLATQTTLASVLTSVQLIDDAVSGAGFNVTQLAGATTPMTTTQADGLALTLDALNVAAFGYVYNGSTLDLMRGDATNGVLVNLGANNDVTVTSGSITANAGTNLNTSALLTTTAFTTVLGTASLLTTTQADDLLNTTDTLNVSGLTYVFDGSAWDRWTGAVTVSGVATAANQSTEITALQLIDNLPNTLGSTTSGQSGVLILGAVTTSAPTYTTAQSNALSLDTAGALRVAITSGAGSGGTSLADDATFTVASTSFTPTGGTYKAARDAVDDNDGGAFAMNQKRGLYASLETPNSDSLADDTLDALKVTNSTASTATSYLTVRISDGTNFLTTASDWTASAPVGTTAPGQMLEAKDFDGLALPQTASAAEGDAIPTAGSLYGITYVMLTSEDGSLQYGTSTTPLVVGDGSGAMNVIVDSGTVTTLSQFAGNAINLGAGAVGTGTLRIIPASDSPGFVVDDAAFTAGTTVLRAVGYVADEASTDLVNEDDLGVARMTLDRVQWAAAAAVSATSQGWTTGYAAVAASTNATNVKASAGNVYGFSLTNTTTTNYYLRMYNLSGTPTCSSATGFVETITIPAGTASIPSGRERWHVNPQAYGTGIGYCITGGASSTDNTNAATGVYVTVAYK